MGSRSGLGLSVTFTPLPLLITCLDCRNASRGARREPANPGLPNEACLGGARGGVQPGGPLPPGLSERAKRAADGGGSRARGRGDAGGGCGAAGAGAHGPRLRAQVLGRTDPSPQAAWLQNQWTWGAQRGRGGAAGAGACAARGALGAGGPTCSPGRSRGPDPRPPPAAPRRWSLLRSEAQGNARGGGPFPSPLCPPHPSPVCSPAAQPRPAADNQVPFSSAGVLGPGLAPPTAPLDGAARSCAFPQVPPEKALFTPGIR